MLQRLYCRSVLVVSILAALTLSIELDSARGEGTTIDSIHFATFALS